MIPGLAGRDPWKADEAYSFGLVLNMIETGDWVVPTLGADPFMEKPPIFYITATLFARLLSPPLALHDAARVASALYMALTLVFVALASRELNGRGTGWVAAVLLLGCLGNVHSAHMLVTDNSLLTGFALALYGLSLGQRRPWIAGLLCGTGAGLAFLSKGLLGPGMIGIAVACLPLFLKAWRTRAYVRLVSAMALAALPWLIIWTLLLYRRSPVLFMVWFWNNNMERFMGVGLGKSETTPLHYLKELPLLAWPALPLAIWTLWRGGRGVFQHESVRLPLLYFAVMLAVLSLAGQRRSNYMPPMFLPLALLAVRSVDTFSPRAAKAMNLWGFSLFSFMAAVVWFAWSTQFTGFPGQVLEIIRKQVPDYVPKLHGAALGLALAATLGWALLIIYHRGQSRFVALHWTAGVTLIYLLGMTLWLPITNQNMTYRHDFARLREALGEHPGMVSGRGLGEPQRAMIHYYAGVRPASEEIRGPLNCPWMLIQGRDEEGWRPQAPDPSWRLAWQGTHHRELFHLYHRGP
jgi:4-amino-4-deoxy-L-arabinose transferase-like glycosyltransferase